MRLDMRCRNTPIEREIKMRVIKKPIEVEAWQLNYSEVANAPDWVKEAMDKDRVEYTIVGTWLVRTLEGIMKARDRDYLIKGIRGELYPCMQSIFEETYEVIDG